jgi:hypothetical protein
MSLQTAVAAELAGQEGWRVEMALALAAEVEAKGTASAAKELRGLMAELSGAAPAKDAEVTKLSEFEQRLRDRESKAAASRSSAG